MLDWQQTNYPEGVGMPNKILIVDDEIDTLRLIGMMLESKGFQIFTASSGEKAISIAENEQPDLILLDIMMPGIDGYDVTRQLRLHKTTRSIPIIIFTARSSMDDRVQGLELGADAYLTKPISSRELLAHIKAVLARCSKSFEPISTRESGQMIGIIAAKGGLGASTVTLNLAIAIHQHTKKDVLLADFRPGLGSIGLELGYNRPEGLNHLLQLAPKEITHQSIENELVRHSSGLRMLLSSSQPKDARQLVAVNQFETIARLLPQIASYVCLDVGPGITSVNERVLNLCNNVLVIIEPNPQSVAQGIFLVNDLMDIGLGEGQIFSVVVNRVRSSMQLTISQVQEQLGRNPLIVFTPDPELAYQASTQRIPMVLLKPGSLATQQFGNLAASIV
jgi:DNA-binding response OmpR family regulator